MKNKMIVLIGSVLIIILTIYVRSTMSETEIPSYKVIKSFKNIEVREYDPVIVAQVQVAGEREKAINDGFRLLADYIFGNNISKEKIAMTAPVMQQKGEKIPMTAPVTQVRENDHWLVEFTMPSVYTMESLPKPNNSKVVLKRKEAGRCVVVRFSGLWNQNSMKENQDKLDIYVKDNDIGISGPPTYAFYNPPWTLPFLRRNEIIYTIKEK